VPLTTPSKGNSVGRFRLWSVSLPGAVSNRRFLENNSDSSDRDSAVPNMPQRIIVPAARAYCFHQNIAIDFDRFQAAAIFKAEQPSHLTPHLFAEYLSLAAGCPKLTGFPRKNGREGVRPVGHGKSSNSKKVLKYSVNEARPESL
jgi:hypothetical protein